MTFSAIFDVRGEPKPQPRPRAFARKMGGKYVARVFEAGTAEAWKSCVVEAGREHRPMTPLAGPLRVRIEFMLKRPKRLMRKSDPAAPIWHTAKPDLDNLAKGTLDAMTQDGWWRDDGSVAELVMTKYHHAKDAAPGARIIVEELK